MMGVGEDAELAQLPLSYLAGGIVPLLQTRLPLPAEHEHCVDLHRERCVSACMGALVRVFAFMDPSDISLSHHFLCWRIRGE